MIHESPPTDASSLPTGMSFRVASGTNTLMASQIPIWSSHYRDYLVHTLGILAARFDERRLRKEVAPRMLSLAREIANIPEGIEGNPFQGVEARIRFGMR